VGARTRRQTGRPVTALRYRIEAERMQQGDMPSEPAREGAPPADTGGKAPAEPATKAKAAPSAPRREHRWLVRVIIWGTTVLAVVAIFAVWANRQLLNPNNWSHTSTKFLQDKKIREATSNYLVDQLYANVNVADELKARLPTQLQPLAAPVAGALQNVAVAASERALANAHVQEAWKEANRASIETFIAIVEGKGALSTNHGEVILDLAPIVTNITNRLGLPNVSSKLPPSVAHVKILKSEDLKAIQDGVKALKGLDLLLTIIVPVLYALAILLAWQRRRQALMSVGIAIAFAGLLVYVGRTIIIHATVDSLVKVEANREPAEHIMSIATGMLSEIAGAFIIVGIPLIAAAWFAGPARLAVKGRRSIAPFLRQQPGWTYGIVAAIMLLVFIWNPIPATGKLAGIIVFLALAFFGTYLLRNQTAREFPAPAGSATG
jgi:hypothetical protein